MFIKYSKHYIINYTCLDPVANSKMDLVKSVEATQS